MNIILAVGPSLMKINYMSMPRRKKMKKMKPMENKQMKIINTDQSKYDKKQSQFNMYRNFLYQTNIK